MTICLAPFAAVAFEEKKNRRLRALHEELLPDMPLKVRLAGVVEINQKLVKFKLQQNN